jgi:hypothetical protein
MSLKCRIFRDEKGQIDFVNAENGNRSKLFDKLVDITGGNKNTALNIYALTEVDELKESMGIKLNALKERFKSIVKVAPSTSTRVEEIMFSKTASTTPTYYSNAISAINNLADKNPKNTQGWIKQLTDTQKNGGVRNVNQELEWIGLEDYLNEYVKENSPKAGNIPASVVEDYIKANQIEIVDVSKGKPEIDINDLDAYFDGSGFVIKYYGQGNIIMPYITIDQIGLTEEDTYEEDFDYYSAREDAKKAAIEEVLDREDGDVKYQGYQLKGGENYREVLLTMPRETSNSEKEQAQEEWEKLKIEADKLRAEGKEVPIEMLNRAKELTEIKNKTEKQSLYSNSHWDEANILAHVRLNEKTLPDGRKVLIVNEMQSDWAQDGRKKGFKDPVKEAQREELRLKIQVEKDKVRAIESELENLKPLTNEEKFELNQQKLKLEETRNNVRNNRDWDALGEEITKIDDKLDDYENTKNRLKSDIYTLKYEGDGAQAALEEELSNFDEQNRDLFNKVQEMPYKNTDQWVGLATRRVLQMAAQEGYDGVSFATGQQSSDMYSLSNQVDEITAIQNMIDGENIGTYTIYGMKDDRTIFSKYDIAENELESYIGKELAKTIIEENKNNPYLPKTSFKGVDLKVGGEGMKTFYNSIVPKVAQKEAQRFDKNAKLESVDFSGIAGVSIVEENEGFTLKNDNTFIEYVDEETLIGADFETTKQGAEKYFKRFLPEYFKMNKLALTEQPFIAITDKMRSELGKAIPMFSKNQGQEAPREVLDQVTDRLEQSGLASNVYKMTNAQIEAKLIEFGVTPTVLDIYISKGKVIVEC